MPPSQQPRERVGTPFDNGDGDGYQIDLHKATEASVYSYPELLSAREATGLAFEATSSHMGRVDGGAVVSLMDREISSPEINLTPLEEVRLMSYNLPILRQRVVTGVMLPLQSRVEVAPLHSPNRDDFTQAA